MGQYMILQKLMWRKEKGIKILEKDFMLRNLRIKVFKKADKEWVRFILKNRDSDRSVHDYDIVIGPTADENTVTVINSYREELLATDYADEVLDALEIVG